jgi:hypothetical protein
MKAINNRNLILRKFLPVAVFECHELFVHVRFDLNFHTVQFFSSLGNLSTLTLLSFYIYSMWIWRYVSFKIHSIMKTVPVMNWEK